MFITYAFSISLLIYICIIIYSYIAKLLKSESKLKEERIKILQNRIINLNKEIPEIEKEIEKLS